MDATTRQGYRLPLDNEQFDIQHQNYNWTKADLINGVTICTSGTRPGTPSPGMMIYETDTGQQRVWVAGSPGSWVITSAGPVIICTSATRPNPSVTGQVIWETDTSLQYICIAGGSPGVWSRMTPEYFGYIGGKRYTTPATLGTVTTAEALVGMDTGSIVWEAKSYIIDVSVEVAVSVATTNALLRVRESNLAGAVVGTFRLPTQPATTKYHYNFSFTYMPTAGTRTLYLSAQRDVGTPTITITSTAGVTPHMLARKVGPSGQFLAV